MNEGLPESRSTGRIGPLNSSNEGVQFHPLVTIKNLSSALLRAGQYAGSLRPSSDTCAKIMKGLPPEVLAAHGGIDRW
jgi:hypothetical protein